MPEKKIEPELTVEKFKEMVTELSHHSLRKRCLAEELRLANNRVNKLALKINRAADDSSDQDLILYLLEEKNEQFNDWEEAYQGTPLRVPSTQECLEKLDPERIRKALPCMRKLGRWRANVYLRLSRFYRWNKEQDKIQEERNKKHNV